MQVTVGNGQAINGNGQHEDTFKIYILTVLSVNKCEYFEKDKFSMGYDYGEYDLLKSSFEQEVA